MENFRKAWREGAAPLISDEGLLALHRGLVENDKSLIHGATTSPPPLACTEGWKVEGACLLAYCGWKGDGLETVGEVEEYFARMAYEIDCKLGEPAGVRFILNPWDSADGENPAEVRKILLEEVEREINRRKEQTA